MKKYIFFYILLLLGGCTKPILNKEMVVTSVDNRQGSSVRYTLNHWFILRDSVGKYNIGDTLIIKKK